ncbi:MAG: hypothetical protein GVY08_01840 [Bacteroidetes bacterium]|jgi:hypothetical protein|nr:hypothetical protein [Bacteroidota bacterium]
MSIKSGPDSKTIIEQFFDEQFSDTSRFFLYKDKQLLKNGEYATFARHRLQEVRRAFFGGVCFFLLFMLTGISYYFQYSAGAGSEVFQLTVSVLNFIAGIGILFFSTKEYYSIKSSMTLLLILLEEEKSVEGDSIGILET